MYNLLLPKLHANYCGLPTTVQLRADHEQLFTGRCFAANWPSGTVLYMHLNGILLGTESQRKMNFIGGKNILWPIQNTKKNDNVWKGHSYCFL